MISIITINYNNLKGLNRTVDSVLNQKYRNIEYIIIDGNSTDGSKTFLEKINGGNLIVISENDDGLYDAMNKGLENAKGDYVLFMNSGDCFVDSNVLTLMNSIIEEEYLAPKFVYGDAFDKDYNANEKYCKKAKSHTKYWYGMFANHQSMLFSTKIINNYSLKHNLEYKLSADWDFVIRFLQKIDLNTEVVYINKPISIFELGGYSSNFVMGIKEQFTIRRNSLHWNYFYCFLISYVHLTLNILRKHTPFIYKFYVKLRST